jgi:hypothetical protein
MSRVLNRLSTFIFIALVLFGSQFSAGAAEQRTVFVGEFGATW